MNIAIISSSSKISGAELVLKDLLLNSTLSKNTIILSPLENKLLKDIDLKEYMRLSCLIEVSKKNIMKSLIQYLFSIIKIGRIIKNKKIDIGIGNNTIDLVYSKVFKIMNKKFYAMVHDIVLENTPRAKLLKYFDSNIYKYIVVSNAVKNQLIKLGIEENKVEVIYNGLLINKENKSKSKLESPLKLGFIGSIDERKNPNLYLDIIKKIKKEIKLEASIVYHFAEEDLLKKLLVRNEKENLEVNFMGILKREEIKKYLKKIDFLVITSKNDPLPTVVLEAFAEGTPVIGISNDGIPEMIENQKNGFLFKEIDEIDLIAKKIKKMTFKEYAFLSENCLKTIEEKFSIQTKVSKFEKLLKNEEKNENIDSKGICNRIRNKNV